MEASSSLSSSPKSTGAVKLEREDISSERRILSSTGGSAWGDKILIIPSYKSTNSLNYGKTTRSGLCMNGSAVCIHLCSPKLFVYAFPPYLYRA